MEKKHIYLHTADSVHVTKLQTSTLIRRPLLTDNMVGNWRGRAYVRNDANELQCLYVRRKPLFKRFFCSMYPSCAVVVVTYFFARGKKQKRPALQTPSRLDFAHPLIVGLHGSRVTFVKAKSRTLRYFYDKTRGASNAGSKSPSSPG